MVLSECVIYCVNLQMQFTLTTIIVAHQRVQFLCRRIPSCPWDLSCSWPAKEGIWFVLHLCFKNGDDTFFLLRSNTCYRAFRNQCTIQTRSISWLRIRATYIGRKRAESRDEGDTDFMTMKEGAYRGLIYNCRRVITLLWILAICCMKHSKHITMVCLTIWPSHLWPPLLLPSWVMIIELGISN